MGCVNKSSKEFKNLSERHNLDSNALELIVHKYWLETGNETLFPTDVYIQAQLGNALYQEDGRNVREMWKRHYSSTKEFPTLQEVQAAYKEASRYFPKSAIYYYRNAKGNFMLSVKKPVKAINRNKEDFFYKLDNMAPTSEGKILGLNLKENRPYDISKVEELYNKFNTDRTSKDLANKVFNLAKSLGLSIAFNDTLPEGTMGRYTNNNSIVYRKSFLENDAMNNLKAPILLHEVLHAVSMYALSDQINESELSVPLRNFKVKMNSLYQDLKTNPLLKGERGIVDVREFVAELGNPVFRSKIQEIDKLNKANAPRKSFWGRVLDAFKMLLGIHTSNSYYERSMKALDEALGAFDIDTYMRYNGLKRELREVCKTKDINANISTLKQDIAAAFDSKIYDKELLSIKQKAISDGTFMKAPNGKTTNLNERQWLQVRTQNFKEWFGDWEKDPKNASKVVDENGEPLVVWHGTHSDFKSFSKEKLGSHTNSRSAKLAFFAASSKLNSARYAKLEELMSATDVMMEAHEFDPNLTMEDVGAADDISEQDELKYKAFIRLENINIEYMNLASKYSKYLNDKGERVATTNSIEVSEAMEWIENKDLEDYKKEGYTITPEQEKLYKEGKTINLTKNEQRYLTHLDAYGRFKEDNEFTRKHRKEINNYYDKLKEAQKINENEFKDFVGKISSDYLIALFLNVKNPKVDDDKNQGFREESYASRIQKAIQRGNDGGVIKNTRDPLDTDVYYFFNPNQVKSADFNSGEFSRFNDEIANYNIDNSNINYILSENEKKDILREISKINRAKRSLIDIGNDFLYIIDHTDKDGLKHLKDGQEGFLCKEIIDIKGFSKEEINQLKEEYDLDKGSQEATRGLNNWLERNGYSKRYFNWDNSSIENRGGNKKNDRVDPQEQRQASLRGRGSRHLQEDFPIHEVKTGYDGTNHPRYMDARDFIDSMNNKDLVSELSLIKQESADYNLVNDVEEEHKKSSKAIPQDFTFNDGTTIKAPFRPNEQQVAALNAMSDFIKSKETSMTLSGYAGTGKTSLMEMIAKKCLKQHKPVMFCATTNKAAAVLNDRVSKAGFKASTLNKTFGISVEVDPNAKSYNAKKLVNNLKEVDMIPGTTIIIDEASMINEENYGILNRIADDYGLKIIYVGDQAQLAPINEEQISKVFRNGDGKVITLTQVERTDDNAILKEATAIRNNKPLSGETSFNSKGEGVAYISPTHQDAIDEVIAHYVDGLKKDPNHFRILAYTNKAVSSYNNKVRSLLGYTSPIPQKGEPMTGYANWGYDWRTKSYRFINSESYKVVATGKPQKTMTRLDDGTAVYMEAVPITLEDSLGNKDTFDFMDIKGNPQNRQAAMILANEKKRLWAKARQVYGRDAKAEIYAKINSIDSFLFVNDNIEDDKHNTLQAKTIDFGYAMTVHKSQGSTFTNVLMDDVDISRVPMNGKNAAYAMEVVDLGEDNTRDMSNAQMTSAEEVDLGDLSDVVAEPATSNESNAQVANVKQQLEYVGVSRATDTVTIISNHIKKEGSPLHPEKNIKEDKEVQKDSFSKDNNNTTNNNNNVNNGTEYKQTDEFRRVQEAVRGSGKEASRGRSVFEGYLTPDQRQRLANVLGRQLGSIDSFVHGSSRNVTNQKHNTSFNIHSDVNPVLFHDIFEVVRYYTKNAELVDLHEDYSDCKCYLSEDGTTGFAIESDGNLVSVFNLGTTRGFLGAIKDMIREEGATHLDAYASSKQNLEQMCEKTLGFHTAATMDYNREYDHDDIAKNHGNPQVVFMVDHEVKNPKHFDKDSYDEAKEYQMQQVKGETQIENPTFEEGQSFRVSLPGYEYFKDFYEDTTVDASWKVPYLRELDAQLSGDKPGEEIQNILNQMDNVLQAISEKEYLDDLKESKVNKVDKQLEEYDKFVQQLDNLMEGGNEDYKELGCTIKATEIRHTVELIVNEISDEITRLQKEEGRAEKIFPDLNTNLDFQTATRKQIVEAVNINRLVDRVKNMFDPKNADYDDTDIMLQAALIIDNWGAFMTLAQDLFVFNEGFGLTRDYSNGSFKTSEATKTDVDNFNNYSNDPDVAAEQGEKDEQEKWQIDSRTVDPLTSMSALVRQGLHECYLLDENGNKVMSKWGIAERVDPREALNSILRWTQGCLSLDDMIAKLSEKQPSSPWLQQLINRLSDKSGKETDFQSQFYGVFSKDFQPYSIVLLEDGKYHVMPVNNRPALSEVMKSISAKFRIGEHSLFGLNGSISSRDLGSEETVNSSKPNLHKSYAKLSEIAISLKKGNELDDTMSKEATESIIDACNILGFDGVTDTMLTDVINKENIKKEAEYLGYIVKDLDKALAAQKKGELKEFNPFKYGVKYGIDGSLRNFLTPITDKMEDTAVNAFYDSGKMYQSYVTPSFMTKLMKKFKQEGQKLEDFLMDEYACSEWFAYNKTPELNMVQWRNEWLRLLARDENARKVFDHHVELNFNKHNYMRNMTDAEYTISLITEYFGESTKANDMTPAWFRIPMLSNKPSSEFIKFYSYRGMDYKDSIVRGLHSMFLQELSRIQTVRMRNHSKNDPEFIKNFDSNGRKFNFLPVFNDYMEDNVANKAKRELLHNTVEYDEERYNELKQKEEAWQEARKNSSVNADGSVNFNVDEELRDMQLTQEEQAELNALKARKEASDKALTSEEDDKFATLLQKKIKGETALTDEEEVEFGKLADKIIHQFMENRVQSILDNWEENGILESAKTIKNIYPSELDDEQANKWVREQVENFLWNDAFASKNILQLTIGDIAFYKDTEDLQKRLAQLHAPGMRGRIDAIDYDGNRVSDGKYRTFILKDFDSFKSNIIANISEVFDRKITAASEDEKPQWRALKESLVGEKGKYTRINVTDAQGYSSPSSYRKKAFIFGRWSHDAENTYKKILDGNYTLTDFETAFQPLKPFVYSRLTKNMGVEGAPIQTMRVPFQAKNAEYLLIMADAILQGEKLSRPNLLRAVYRVMEDSERINPTMGIDTVQFESAIKSGLQNPINIFQFRDMEGGEDAAYTYMMNQIYKKQEDAEGNRTYKDYDTDTSVHETSYEDYCLQQEVPAHFKEHSQAHGSQIRMITPSDLDLYTTDENGNQVDNYYTWKEPDGTVRKVKADEFRKEYEKTIAENIEESIINLSKELHLEGTKKERNLALSKILLKEISSSPRYGIDLALACQVDKETGDFRIPKGDPIQAKRIEQLINSIIKNRVNKQKIAGGPIVQVSNFGTSKQLHIRFNDRQGNLMPLEEEYNPSEHDNLSYKDYCKKNQGGIAYFEVFCPMWNDEIYQKFANQDGTINIDAINAMDPEFLKMVSYRIPTEDKYSCAPMKVVGFMPREAGDAIMFPYELTEIDDSDFDVDKRYVMRKSIPIKRKSRKDIEDALFKKATKRYAEMTKGGTRNVSIGNEIRMFMDNPERMRNTSKFMQWLYKQYQSIAYKTDAPTSGKDYRDNKIIDMTYAVLTNEMTADKILNPGGFDAPKKIAYKITAYKRLANEGYKWEDLQGMDTDELKAVSYQDKDLTFADTQVQFYKQNAAAASLIGVFAVNKVAHAVLEGNDIYLDVLNNLTKKPFVIGDNVFGGKKVKGENRKDMVIIDNSLQGKMLIDGKYDRNGTLIGKTLGSLVSASADAVKDPILNLINVNMTTAGMLNTMLRLGMPFDDAAMFLSQDIIERLLSQFNRENLTNSVSLDSLINKWLDNYRKMQGLTEDSKINSEGLTMDELVEGLTPNEHSTIDYKVLLAFQRLKELTDFMRKPTFATRFNSISSAVGPLIIDNLITEHRIEGFKDTNMNGGTPFSTYDNYVNDWMPVDIDDVFTDHPILKQFSRTVDLAKDMLSDMPANSPQFRNMLGIGIEKSEKNEENIDILPSDIAEKMFGDKKLLDQFSNFYQSYLLIQSGLVNPSHLKDYATGFPKWFMEQKFAEKYPDNALIKAIRMNIAKNTGRPYLQINITGMDEQQKEELRYAWIDLHKEDPELSKMLFDYSFFRAGIGFSPKTFMALVPSYVKERLKSKDESTSYVDTFRKLPTVVPHLVIDQFIRNNWNNNKLIPWRGGENTHYNIDIKHDRLTVYRPEDRADVENVTYIKTKAKDIVYLWHKVMSDDNGIVFERVKPLGNNGEYLEISLNEIKTPLVETLRTSEENETSDLEEKSFQDTSAEETSEPIKSETLEPYTYQEFVDMLQKQAPTTYSREQAEEKAMDIKHGRGPRQYKYFLQTLFKNQKGLELNVEEAIKEMDKYCF